MNTRIQKIVDAVKKNGHDGIASDRTEKLFCNRRTV